VRTETKIAIGAILGVILVESTLSISAQQPPRHMQVPDAAEESECRIRLERALEAIRAQQELIAELEKAVKRLELELADCKQQQTSESASHE
jgi:hypothetical protein